MNEITINGSISEDGKLQAIFTEEYRNFLKVNSSEKLIIKISVMSKKGTILQKVYFEKVILPCLQRGFRDTGDDMTIDDVYERILQICPATFGHDPSDDLTKLQCSELIDWSIRYCAENFSIIVPETKKT